MRNLASPGLLVLLVGLLVTRKLAGIVVGCVVDICTGSGFDDEDVTIIIVTILYRNVF